VSSAIEVQELVKRYGHVPPAVNGVTLSVDPGEIVGYLGPNGAGKTTTIRCLLGLLRPSSGSIQLLGARLPGAIPQVLERVGHLPGEFGLWPQMTGAGCLDYLGKLQHRRPRRRAELCDRFELSQTDLARQVRFYSRGMRQKVAIVQTFQHDPELVIMDEPTEGLDPVMKERFLQLLDEHRAAGGSTLLSSHILSEVEQVSDRVVVLRAGIVVREISRHDLEDRVRHCAATFAMAATKEIPEMLPGAFNLARVGDTLRFDHRGDMAPLIAALAALPVVDFVSEPGSLLDVFFEIYGTESR
jgi:ABC-2 type transport system ATP-binding protein